MKQTEFKVNGELVKVELEHQIENGDVCILESDHILPRKVEVVDSREAKSFYVFVREYPDGTFNYLTERQNLKLIKDELLLRSEDELPGTD